MPSGASGFTLICTPGGMLALPPAHADDPAGLNSPADPAAPDGGLAHASGDICALCALCTLLHGLAAPVALALLPLPPATAPGPRLPTARPLLPPTPWALHPARAPPPPWPKPPAKTPRKPSARICLPNKQTPAVARLQRVSCYRFRSDLWITFPFALSHPGGYTHPRRPDSARPADPALP